MSKKKLVKCLLWQFERRDHHRTKKIIDEEKNINVLVLAANSDPKSKESNVIINSLVNKK